MSILSMAAGREQNVLGEEQKSRNYLIFLVLSWASAHLQVLIS